MDGCWALIPQHVSLPARRCRRAARSCSPERTPPAGSWTGAAPAKSKQMVHKQLQINNISMITFILSTICSRGTRRISGRGSFLRWWSNLQKSVFIRNRSWFNIPKWSQYWSWINWPELGVEVEADSLLNPAGATLPLQAVRAGDPDLKKFKIYYV